MILLAFVLGVVVGIGGTFLVCSELARVENAVKEAARNMPWLS